MGDFNQDGKLNLAVGITRYVSVLLGNGDGTFQSPLDSGDVGFHSFGPSSLVQGDFDGDGKVDLAVTNLNDNPLTALLRDGDGTFDPPEPSGPS